ncbi:FG-GAP-like repeat-containing protein [Streptomyces caniscabiei]|uniref:VCBS repeat-containing protein n=1 Tax=Streptomyces caniscabiei TaxID=2746961 RepID=A0A927QI18_9ACTN|nr:FG-GAP-like repeat-containing protein [Streptomyces caniscabiei]MBD9722502.1 VCBS repeat-containing protein [Streptomyces caniscabiei]MDX3515174.1 FG-GAP-like repeat-containing protein [Streptomyces caniscabiei]MDX3716544.1 FG-GAP-like repeat-containing protein [Streptomyces caniscabiei]WEO22438.1 FG-GAP-like repeat-containing protein [Streptomyces caniscabiei]
MPVPTEELNLQIVNAATGKTLGAKATPGTDGALVVRDFPDGGPSPEQWQLTPLQAAQGQDDQAYVIRNAVSGKVLDNATAAGRGVCQGGATASNKNQHWHVVPVDGEAGLYFIEDATGKAVLDLADPGPDDTRIILRAHDDNAESQRWRFVTAEPERTSDPVLRYAPLSHWNSRQSWRLTRSPALRPAPGATPSFSDMLLVLKRFGSHQDAGGWKSTGAARPPGGQPGWWAGLGDRLLADTTGAGRADIVGLKPAKGTVTASSQGDATFEDDERVLHQPGPSPSPKDLWTLADTTGDGRPDAVVLAADGVRVSLQDENGTFAPAGGKLVLKAFGHGQPAGGWLADKHPRFLADTTGDGRADIVGCHDDGVWVSLQDEDGTFGPLGDEPVLKAFGHDEKAGGWLADKHPRFLADTTGDGRADIIGCHDDGVWVSLQDEDGTFAEPLYVLDDFGVDQEWSTTEGHPRFLVKTTNAGAVDIVGFGPQGVVVARGRGDGTFEPSQLVLNDFGTAQAWTSDRHLRLLADVTGDGTPDIVGFGDEGVWVAHNRGDGRFEQAQLVCCGFGYNDDAGAWRVDRHPRFLADITGDGRVDIVGFGGPGVYVARNLFRRFRTR